MQRKEFLTKTLGLVATLPFVSSCDTPEPTDETEVVTSTGTTNGSSAQNCVTTPTETVGPFPNQQPNSLVRTLIQGDRVDIPLTIQLSIKNLTTGCQPLANVLVDIWHCDAEGEYSQYGGTGMQAANWQNANWLRGRQTTDAAGNVEYKSIFPGWYPGRAPHIHVQIYNAAGATLLVTQIAFPQSVCDLVYTTAKDYVANGKQDTTNARDNVFSDGHDLELATITGSLTEGFILQHTIVARG